jgi:hypothetical protein
MSEQNCTPYVTDCKAYLSQGDIFQISLVVPMADPEIFIFRTADGRRVSDTNQKLMSGRIFTYDELSDVIKVLPSEQRLYPFQRKAEDKDRYERVLVYADLLRYFIVLSQTCDISGVDHSPKPTCTIAPIVTLADYCQGPIQLSYEDPKIGQKIQETINFSDFFCEKFDPLFKDEIIDDFKFPRYLRANLDEWRKAVKNKPLEQRFINNIRNSLNLIFQNKLLFIYYIAPNDDYKVPESYVDFCRLYTLPRDTVENLMDNRLATISSPYREEFARKFAEYYGRIAIPKPMQGEPV